MKKRNVIFYSTFFLLCVAVTAQVVVYQLTGNRLFGSNETATVVDTTIVRCSSESPKTHSATDDPQLKAVSEYEKICDSAFFDTMMIFTNMPMSDDNAIELADELAVRLKRFDAYGIRPIVVIEPDSEWGLIDFHEYAQGDYDRWIDLYFNRLKQNGVTDRQLGIWMPFPEPQQPFWNNNQNPDDFAHSVNRHLETLRKYFPQGKTAILLDSQVADEEASQLVAYTRLIKPSLVDIVGLQGFPWHPSEDGDKREPVVSASQFVPAYMLEEIAKSLETEEVLINTGTYRHRRSQDGGEVAIATAQRKTILDSIVYEAGLLNDAGYTVTVNIFAENKLDVQEQVDWSYWSPGNINGSTHASLFTQFAKELLDKGVSISLFDSRK